MTKPVWWIATTVLGLFAVSEYRSQQSQAETMRSELESLREQQTRLATQVARPAVMVRTQAGTSDERSAAAAVTPSPPPASPAAREDRATDSTARDKRWEDSARAGQASVEDAFAAESVSDAWAPPTRVALQNRLTSLARLSSSALHDVDCRSSICRVEIAHQSADAARQFAQQAFTDPQDPAWNGPVFISPSQPDADGKLVMVMYLGRPGTQLIKPE